MLTLSVLSFVVALSVLIVVHELGHFLLARKAGIPVERFSVGFGPRIFGWKWKETDFCISLFPLGGYVKMQGEEGEEEAQHLPDSFPNKPVKDRIQVVLAGPMMNILFAFLLLPLVFLIGHNVPKFFDQPAVVEHVLPNSPAVSAGLQKGDRLVSIDGKSVSTWETVIQSIALLPGQTISLQAERNSELLNFTATIESLEGKEGGILGVEPWFALPQNVVVGQVQKESPAAMAGFQPKDRITSINGEAVSNWEAMKKRVQKSNGKPMQFSLQRGDSVQNLSVTASLDESGKNWLIGIQGEMAALPQVLKKYPFMEAVKRGFSEATKLIGMTFEVLKKLVTLELSYKTLGGPVQIAHSLAEASSAGFSNFIYFVAFLSIQLGVLNLLPIPVLDGGHLVFLFWEGIRRKPMNIRASIIAQQIGMALLLTLIVFVTWNDLNRLFGVSQWFK